MSHIASRWRRPARQRRRRRVPGRVRACWNTTPRSKRRAPESLAAARHVNRCRDLARPTWNRRTEGFTRDMPTSRPDAFDADIWEVVGALPPDSHPGAPVLRRGLRHRRDHAHHGMPTQHRANRLHRAREQLRNMLKTTAANASRACKLPRPLCRKEPNVTDPATPAHAQPWMSTAP